MRVAAIADVHSNGAALRAVLQHIDRLGADAIVCLGDVVGYNADPVEAMELVLQRCTHVVAGNHDLAVAISKESPGTNAVARTVQEWTREQLDAAGLALLQELPHVVDAGDTYTARHGSYLGHDPTSGYVTSTMIDENLAVIAASPATKTAFCGHTHVPMIAWLADGACAEPRVGPDEIRWPKDAEAVLINPGAVGQPRDRDAAAAYALVDFERRSAVWHRVPYDIERTASAIARAGLPSILIERLKEGR
jgi:diadenosine tetraphosphatase ApaH/serine/threonine PP2A family protein phosphatase